MTEQRIPYALPSIGKEELEAAVRVLQSGWLTQGPRVDEFENRFRARLKARCAIALNSGTSALHLALIALKISSSDEVITTPFTFASTANVIELVGAKTVFADIDKTTFNIDPKSVAERITAQTRAIICVHFAGLPCELTALRKISRSSGIPLIEDATHALGATFESDPVGSKSDFAAFSFYPIKNMTAIEGGMLVTRFEEHAETARILRWYGLTEAIAHRAEEEVFRGAEVLMPGFKYNMNDVQAAVGLVQLDRLGEFNARRRALCELYLQCLTDVEELQLPRLRVGAAYSACHLFVVRLNPKRNNIGRLQFAKYLSGRGISTSYHYKSLHLHQYYREKYRVNPADLPVATAVSESVVSLPLYPAMLDVDVHRICAAVKDAIVHSH